MTCIVRVLISDDGVEFEADRFSDMLTARQCAAAWLQDGAEQAFVDIVLESGEVRRYVATLDDLWISSC